MNRFLPRSSRARALCLCFLLPLTACELLESDDSSTDRDDRPDPVVTSTCGVPLGDYFNIELGLLEVSERFPSGEAWDVDGSFADPYLDVFVWDAASEQIVFDVATTGYASDTTRVDMSELVIEGLYLGPDEYLVLVAVDADNLSDDDIGQLALSVDDLEDNVNCGVVSFTDGAGIVSLEMSIHDDLSR